MRDLQIREFFQALICRLGGLGTSRGHAIAVTALLLLLLALSACRDFTGIPESDFQAGQSGQDGGEILGGGIQGEELELVWYVTTHAGLSEISGSADGRGETARFNRPRDITTDGTYVYMSDTDNHTIRKIVIETGEDLLRAVTDDEFRSRHKITLPPNTTLVFEGEFPATVYLRCDGQVELDANFDVTDLIRALVEHIGLSTDFT